MRPIVSIVRPPIVTPYLPPDDRPFLDLECWQEGGIALSDGSAGLQYQVWHLTVQGTGEGTSIWLDAPNTPPTLMFAVPGIVWARFSFDQNMHPVIAFISDDGPAFWWWDPLVHQVHFTSLPDTAIKPCVTMDDKRSLETAARNNDVVICYLDSGTGNLYFRRERDRYDVEFTWLVNPYDFLKKPYVNKIGMDEGLRLLLEVRGILDP